MDSAEPDSRATPFALTLQVLERAFRVFEAKVPGPVRQPWKDGCVYRYAERTIHQAIIQKLARTLSGLHAVDVLRLSGLFQEQGMIQRALDELGEDILFLSYSLILGERTERHEEFLSYFYAEEFQDPSDIIGSHSSRGMVSREKIRTYINQQLGNKSSQANVAGKILSKAYSGFVHAASPHIMDMYGGIPPRFDVSGELKRFRTAEYTNDALNYFVRAFQSMAFAAKAFDDEKLFREMCSEAAKLEPPMRELRK